MALQPDRGLARGDDATATAALLDAPCCSARWIVVVGWVVVLGAGRRAVHAAEGRAVADRGPRRRVRPRHRAAGLDAAVHGRPDQADRGVLRADSRSRPRTRRSPAFPPSSTATPCCGSKPWEERKKQAAADRRRAAARSSQPMPGRDRVPDQPAVARAVVPLDAGRVRRSCRRCRTPSCSASSTASSTRCASTRACRTCRPTCASTRPRCASASTATSSPTSASPVDTVGRTLETMLGGRQVTRFKREGEQYDVIVQVAPIDRTTPADISDIYVRGARRQHGAAVEPGRRARRRRAAVAQPLQPAARGQDHRRRSRRATRSARR